LLKKPVVIAKIMPVAQRLVIDSSEHVRESFAAVVNELAIVLGREDTIEYLLPILLTLLRDETASVCYYTYSTILHNLINNYNFFC